MGMPEQLSPEFRIDDEVLSDALINYRKTGDAGALKSFFEENVGFQCRLQGSADKYLDLSTQQMGDYDTTYETPYGNVEVVLAFPYGVAVQIDPIDTNCPILKWRTIDEVPSTHSDEIAA